MTDDKLYRCLKCDKDKSYAAFRKQKDGTPLQSCKSCERNISRKIKKDMDGIYDQIASIIEPVDVITG